MLERAERTGVETRIMDLAEQDIGPCPGCAGEPLPETGAARILGSKRTTEVSHGNTTDTCE